MNQNNKVNKYVLVIYWCTRLYTQILGVLLLYGIIGLIFWPPTRIQVCPSPREMPLFFVTFIFAGLFYLIPYKWGVTTVFYIVRLSIYIIISIAVLYLFIENILPLTFDFLSLSNAILSISLAVSAPLSLYLFKTYIHK